MPPKLTRLDVLIRTACAVLGRRGHQVHGPAGHNTTTLTRATLSRARSIGRGRQSVLLRPHSSRKKEKERRRGGEEG
eukprot:13219369-Heterocapsa_arctica.AAC.1